MPKPSNEQILSAAQAVYVRWLGVLGYRGAVVATNELRRLLLAEGKRRREDNKRKEDSKPC
jgi:hypothetical protein